MNGDNRYRPPAAEVEDIAVSEVVDVHQHDRATSDIEDFVRIATCGTPTEAHLLRGVLEAAGLTPHVADANIVQANTWMTQAVGGVRVLVPASEAEAARRVVEEFHAGAYELEGEEPRPVAFRALPSPVFSPDKAVLLGFLLTPAFAAGVHIANASLVGDATRRTGQWIWLALLSAMTIAGAVVMQRLAPGPLILFRTSFVMSFITLVWYFAAGQEQSKTFLATYGPRYQKKSLVKPALMAAAALLAVGHVLNEFE